MRAKAKKTPMCSVSLIAIELKGLAALGEALKNIFFAFFPYIWLLAGPNIAKKGGAVAKTGGGRFHNCDGGSADTF